MFLRACVAMAFLLGAAGAAAQERDDDPIRQFETRVAAYVALHRTVERFVPPQKIFMDPAEAQQVVAAMSAAMRRVRPSASEGEIFGHGGDVATAFRTRIGHGLRTVHLDAADLLAEMRDDTEPGARPPVVNETFSWALGNTMPPTLLEVLPSLPDELQFRFVGRDLVLIDLHANLVVDVLRDALPERTR